jgi:DNA-binding winged helix-turn-helix (wHTH) protein
MVICGKILVDTDSRTVSYGSEIVTLHPKEYNLLLLFLNYPNHVLSYEVIIEKIWDFERIPTHSSIRSHIRSLRQAFKKVNFKQEIIETVHGIGYRLNSLIHKQKEFMPEIAPSLSVLKKFLKTQAIEYLVIDENFVIKSMSPLLHDYCDYPDDLKVGIDVRHAFPEFIGFEAAFEQVRNKEYERFEIQGIARSCNPNRPEYINFYAIADESNPPDQSGEQLLFVFFEDASEHMIYKQRLVQIENETYLLLESARREFCLPKVLF